ncbi:hypothetical protein ACQJBY_023183 [Aegilops geniculata]
MPKRNSNGLSVGRKAKRRRRHLYVVMDDGEGYAIRKIDLSSDDSDDDAVHPVQQRMAVTIEQRLPPALIGLDSPTSEYFAAIGTKIMVTHGRWPNRAVPVFDVCTRRLNLGPCPRACPRYPIYLPLGDKLISLDTGSTELLYSPPLKFSNMEWSWHKLPKPPFKCSTVTSYAAHPDGRTIFVSAKSGELASTFSLDTESELWKRHGEWKLPFARKALFDPELDAWVGLSGDRDTLGYICSSDVPSTDIANSNRQPPAWKLSKERMFGHEPAEEHSGATLAYMGSKSKFCLVQCFSIIDDDYKHISVANEEDRPRRYLLRLTSFSLKYDKNGNLQTSTQRQIRCYKLPDVIAPIPNDLQAFWM